MSLASRPRTDGQNARRLSLLATLAVAAALLTSLFARPQPLQAMPPFAQATGTNCTLCHTMMPGLNSYGRYILRTFYAGLGSDAFHGTSPVWLNENITGRSTGKLDSRNPGHKETYGNLSADVAGLGGNWSYRVEQTIYTNDQSGGGLGNLWAGYNNLLKGEGHLRVGKFGRPVPSVFSNNWYRPGYPRWRSNSPPIAFFRLDWQGEGLRTRTFRVAEPVFEPRRTQNAGVLLIWAQVSRRWASPR